MLNFPNNTVNRRFCSMPYRVDEESGLVVACRNEAVGQISGMVEGLNGELEPIELDLCEYHRDKYGLNDMGPFSIALDKPDSL